MTSVKSDGKTVNVVSRLRTANIITRMLGYPLLDYDSTNKIRKKDVFIRALALSSTLYLIIPGITAMTEFSNDLRYLSKTTSIVISATQNFCLLGNFWYQEKKYRNLIKKMREELWTESLSPILWGHFKKFDRYATIVTGFMIQSFYGSAFMFFLISLWANDFDLYRDVNAIHRTPFIGRYVYDHRPSPQFEITYLSQMVGGFCATTAAIGLVSLYAIICMHLCAKLRLLNLKFTNIDASTSDQDFIDIVREYKFLIQFAEDVEDIHNPILLVHFLLSTILICLNVVMLTSASEKQDTLDCLLCGMYFAAAMTEIFVLCWVANQVLVQSENLTRAIYCSRWYEASGFVQRGTLLTIVRTQRPSVLTAGKFFPVTLESFSTVCSTAASYYTLLMSIA